MNQFITTTDKDGGTYEVPVSELVWRPTAYAIIIQDNQILLSPQWDGYDLPGGGVDIGETPEDGVIREIKEETGLLAQVEKFITYRNCFYAFRKKQVHAQTIMLYFECSIIGGELSTEGFDESEKNYARLAEWVPLEKLHEIKVQNTVDWRPIVTKFISKNT